MKLSVQARKVIMMLVSNALMAVEDVSTPLEDLDFIVVEDALVVENPPVIDFTRNLQKLEEKLIDTGEQE